MSKYLALLILIFANLKICFSQKVNAITANRTAILGSAYQSEKEFFVGQQGVVGDTIYTGVPQSTFNFSQSLTEKEAADQLGFSLGGRARFGAVEASAAARFMKNSVSSSFSISSVWMSEYVLPTEKLANVRYSKIGEELHSNYERWNEAFGDMYVDEIIRGAKLFFSIRVDFNSEEAKQSFQAKFSLSGPLYSANADLQTASQQFSKDAKITISAFQIGGDVSKLTSVFGNSDTSTIKFVQCSLGSFQDCASVIQAAINYASDVRNGFPSQLAPGIKPGGAPLYYNLAKYSAAGIFINNYPFLEITVKQSREELSKIFEKELRLSVLAERLLEFSFDSSSKKKIIKEKEIVESNISKILVASEICYNNPNECRSNVNSLELSSVNESIFDLPPPPNASFRIMTTKDGVWTRSASTEKMNEESKSWRKYVEVDDIKKGGNEASVVLFIEGVALKEADLYFENLKLLTLPLKADSIPFFDKKGINSVCLVLQTSRSIPEWQDIDIKDIIDTLFFRNKIANAEGTFYLMIKDEFDRKTKIDLQYVEWTSSDTKNENYENINLNVRYFTNWWDKDSSGTNASIRNEWTQNSGWLDTLWTREIKNN